MTRFGGTIAPLLTKFAMKTKSISENPLRAGPHLCQTELVNRGRLAWERLTTHVLQIHRLESGLETYSSPDKGGRIVGIIGILLGVFVVVKEVSFFVLAALTPRPTSENALSSFNTAPDAYAIYALATTLFSIFVIAFAGGFSGVVRKRSPSLSSAAALLVAAGALTLAIFLDLEVGSFFAISQAPSTAAYAADATFLAAVVSNFGNFLTVLAGSLIGIGLLLFAWVIWEGEIFPKWLSYDLLIGGVLFFLARIPPTSFLDFVGEVLIGVWGIGAGRALLRTKSTLAGPAK